MSKKPLSNSNLLQQWPWIASMILMLLIFYFSSIPGEEVSQYNDVIIRESVTILPQNTPTFFLRDTSWLKSGHVIGYGLLGITLFLGFSQYYKLSLVLSTLTALLYAVSDEIHQSFVPGRSGSIVDVVLDTAAAFLCAGLLNLVFFVIQRIKITRKSQ